MRNSLINLFGMWLLLLGSLFASMGVQAKDPCEHVLQNARAQLETDAALEVLGGCLAARADSRTHQQVALEMARLSLDAGDIKDTKTYLDILAQMMDMLDEPGHEVRR